MNTPYTSDPSRRQAVMAKLEGIVADLNDTSPECLSAIDSIRQIRLEAEVERLKGALEEILICTEAPFSMMNTIQQVARAALNEGEG